MVNKFVSILTQSGKKAKLDCKLLTQTSKWRWGLLALLISFFFKVKPNASYEERLNNVVGPEGEREMGWGGGGYGDGAGEGRGGLDTSFVIFLDCNTDSF